MNSIAKINQVIWSDKEAIDIRTKMSKEIGARYYDRESISGHLPEGFFVDESTVLFVAIAKIDNETVGHIAIRLLNDEFEIKNMFVLPSVRGKGVAVSLLKAAESFSVSKNATRLILQTGDRQPEAVCFYLKNGYRKIPIFSPYEELSYSNCFEKNLLNFNHVEVV